MIKPQLLCVQMNRKIDIINIREANKIHRSQTMHVVKPASDTMSLFFSG